MFENQLTLSVDALNNGVKANQVFNRYDDSNANRSLYIGPDHSLILRNTLGFYRTEPKKNGTSRGVAKSAIKFTQDVTVAGIDSSVTLTSPLIIDVGFSVPVGVTKATLVAVLQRAIAFLDDDELLERLALKLEV